MISPASEGSGAAHIRARHAGLAEERASLAARLAELEASRPVAPDEGAIAGSPVTDRSPPAKIALFRSLFTGREDASPRRWEHEWLSAPGAALRPKVHCVQEPADQGSGHPDFALHAAWQMQKGRAREGQLPECGVVEVKPLDDDARVTATGGRRPDSGTPVAISGAKVGPVGKCVNADHQGVVDRYRADDIGGSRLARSGSSGLPAGRHGGRNAVERARTAAAQPGMASAVQDVVSPRIATSRCGRSGSALS